MTLNDSSQMHIAKCISFLKQTYNTPKKDAVIAVSGGIDSALCVTLLTQALGTHRIRPVLLPYGTQSTQDSELILSWNKIPKNQWVIQNIAPTVDLLSEQLLIGKHETVRRGNIMARARMVIVFDTAKRLDALVCGTENKSEHYLGYFTRFGDGASDVEPILGLYKTQVREIATHLQLPSIFLQKAPSAGLWEDQSDEQELGFSYDQADRVIAHTLGEKSSIDGIEDEIVQKIQQRIVSQAFKLKVPYTVLE